MTVEIVRFDHRCLGDVAVLLKKLWSKDAGINERYMRWRYLANPLIEPPLLYLAVDDGSVIGVRGARGVAWDIGAGDDAQRCIVPCLGDTVIADSHANEGLLSKLTAALLEDMVDRGIPYSFNLSPGRVTLLSSLTAGWRSIGKWPTVVRREPTNESGRRSRVFSNLDRHLEGRDPGNEAICVSNRPMPGAIARISATPANRGQIRPFVNADYLVWRFQNPLSEYRFLYHESGDIDGYLVLQSSTRRPHRTNVLDMQATEPEILASLIRAAATLGKFTELRLWWLRLPVQAMRVLEELDFGCAGSQEGIARFLPTFLVRPTSIDVSKSSWSINGVSLLDPGSWEIKMLVSDTS